ncbi:DUF6010 family protein [Streptomyces lunaelactis]|uniref:DUF6010 family protein n=2 Tax=Streptomyces lunaelactis TaxID=1535768 RepID=UPI0035A1B222
MTIVGSTLIGIVYVILMSPVHEPDRRRFNAITVSGAGAAHLSGGDFGAPESSPSQPLSPTAPTAGSTRGRSSASNGCCTPAGTCSTT